MGPTLSFLSPFCLRPFPLYLIVVLMNLLCIFLNPKLELFHFADVLSSLSLEEKKRNCVKDSEDIFQVELIEAFCQHCSRTTERELFQSYIELTYPISDNVETAV